MINKKPLNFKSIDFRYKDNKVYIKHLNTNYDKYSIDISNFIFDIKTQIAKIDLDLSKYEIYHKKNKINNIKLFFNLKNDSYITINDTNGLVKSNILIDKDIVTNIQLNNLNFKYNNEEKVCKNIRFDLPTINFNLKNGSIFYKNKLIKYDTLSIKTKNKMIKSTLNIDKSNINIIINNRDTELNAKNINSTYINNIFGLEILKHGIVDLNINGTQCKLNGKIKIKDLILKEYKIQNATANISLNRETDFLTLNNIDAKGDKYFIKGDAIIEFDKYKINSKLNINFMKNYSSLVSKIPLFGYLLLGEDKEIAYTINIQGDLKNPSISTKFIKETTLIPLNILKRVITLPLKPFDKQ